MTRQKAIEAMCRECCCDELDDGTWRMQVERCELSDCPLYQYCPVSRSNNLDVASWRKSWKRKSSIPHCSLSLANLFHSVHLLTSNIGRSDS